MSQYMSAFHEADQDHTGFTMTLDDSQAGFLRDLTESQSAAALGKTSCIFTSCYSQIQLCSPKQEVFQERPIVLPLVSSNI